MAAVFHAARTSGRAGARARSVAHALDVAVVGTDIREDSRRYSVFIVEVRRLVCAASAPAARHEQRDACGKMRGGLLHGTKGCLAVSVCPRVVAGAIWQEDVDGRETIQ